jgi:hypothetical protein
MALGIVPGDSDSTTKAFIDIKTELDNEKDAWKVAQIETDKLARVVKDLKISADKFSAQIPTREDQVRYLVKKVVDKLNELEPGNSAQSTPLMQMRTTRNRMLN